jgi:hypothetical protein
MMIMIMAGRSSPCHCGRNHSPRHPPAAIAGLAAVASHTAWLTGRGNPG